MRASSPPNGQVNPIFRPAILLTSWTSEVSASAGKMEQHVRVLGRPLGLGQAAINVQLHDLVVKALILANVLQGKLETLAAHHLLELAWFSAEHLQPLFNGICLHSLTSGWSNSKASLLICRKAMKATTCVCGCGSFSISQEARHPWQAGRSDPAPRPHSSAGRCPCPPVFWSGA